MRNIIHYYPRAFVGNGGVTIAVWRFIKAFKNKGNNIWIAFDKSLDDKQPLEIKGTKRIKVKHFFNGRYSLPENFLKNFNKNTIVILHSGFLIRNIIVSLYALKIGAKAILVPHGCYDPILLKEKFLLKRIFIFIEKYIYKYLFFIQAFTEKDKKNIAKIFKNNRIEVIPVPIPVLNQSKFKKGKKNYFSYVGRYEMETKGLDLLIKTYEMLPNELKIPIIMHGTNGKKTNINDVKNYVKEKKQQNYIKVLGPIYGHKKLNFIKSSYMTIQLSRWDCFPLSVFESIALGVPCLLSKNATISELIKKNKLGFITDLNIKSIIRKLIYIIRNKKKIINMIKKSYFIEEQLSSRAIKEKFYKKID